jgi:glycosyltransferase involved in cell wall biosynthesis
MPCSQDEATGPSAPRALRVLYIHPIGVFGGSSRSLLELIDELPPDAVQPRVLTARGNFAPLLARRGVETIIAAGIARFDNTRFGRYQGRRWLLLMRELYLLPGTLLAVRRAYKAWPEVDIIHVNEITAVPAWWYARRLFGRPVVVHVRSVQENHPTRRRTQWMTRLLRGGCEQVIAIDETVRESLPEGIPAEIVHNVFSVERASRDVSFEARLDALPIGGFRVGFVGNFLGMKGLLDLVEAIGLCRARGVDVRVLVVGANPRRMKRGMSSWLLGKAGFMRDLEAETMARADTLRVRDRVHLLGFNEAIGSIYGRIDAICFPSHLEAIGRPVLEAAFFGKPSIVAISAPRPDTLVDGVTGIAFPPGDIPALADAIERLAVDRQQLLSMGVAARELATQNFDAKTNAEKILAIYRRLAAAR